MQQLRQATLVAVLILFAAFVSRSLAEASVETLPVWLGSGVTFAALLVGARWTWPATLVGAGVALAIWGVVGHQLGPGPALVFGAIEIASMGVGAWIATLDRHDPESATGAALLITPIVIWTAIPLISLLLNTHSPVCTPARSVTFCSLAAARMATTQWIARLGPSKAART